MSTPRDFICFPFLSFWQKCRLAMGILYSTKLNNVTKLDRIYARQWLTKVFGRRVYEKIWDPLLRSKLGSARDKTSAAFIWATIKRLYGARSAENKQEKMGHVHGGYQTILHAAAKRLKELGVIIKTDTPIINVQSTQHMRQTQSTSRTNQTKPTNQSTQAVQVETPNNQFEFDKVLLTTDCPTVLRMLGGRLHHLYWERLSEIEYLGVISLMLILDRSLSPYYVINLLDQTMPFTGIIESTNVVDPRELQSRHIVFLPKYITADDPAHQMADDQVIELFFGNLQRVFPDLNHSNVLHAKVFREKFVQPLQTLYHLEQTVGIQTPIDHIYLANTAMIQNSTLNNNAAVALGKKAAGVMLDSE
jgi:protoporphyrinogen oxidase